MRDPAGTAVRKARQEKNGRPGASIRIEAMGEEVDGARAEPKTRTWWPQERLAGLSLI
jgi:hypothetical protein